MAIPAFGLKLIEEKIRSEIRKMIDEKASSVFLSSVLPMPADPEKTDSFLDVTATLHLTIEKMDVAYAAIAGISQEQMIHWAPESRDLELHTAIRAKKTTALEGSSEIKLSVPELKLSASVDGIQFKQTMMGIGAVLHGASFEITISGSGKAVWAGKGN